MYTLQEQKALAKFSRETVLKDIKETKNKLDHYIDYDLSVDEYFELKLRLNFLENLREYLLLQAGCII